MTRRLTQLALGAALLIWAGVGLTTAAQQEHTGGTKQSADDKMMDRMTAGMSAAEKKFLREHMAKMDPDHRKMMIDHIMQMSPAERRKITQQMMNGSGMHGDMHGHRNMHGHGSDANPPSGKSGQPATLSVGDKVPDFEVRDLDGKTRLLSDLRKQTKSGVVSLTFWCSFCHSCRHVEAQLDRFAGDNKNQAVVTAIDASAGETAEGVTAFAKNKGLSLPILMDAPGKAADLFGVKVTTTTVVIDGQGILRYRGQFLDRDQMFASDALKAVLAGKPVDRKETPQRG